MSPPTKCTVTTGWIRLRPARLGGIKETSGRSIRFNNEIPSHTPGSCALRKRRIVPTGADTFSHICGAYLQACFGGGSNFIGTNGVFLCWNQNFH